METNAKGRDEQRKLRGAFLNNLAVASAIAAFLRPLIKVLDGAAVSRADFDALLILGLASYILHILARREVRRMEG